MSLYNVEVTREDIKGGRPRLPRECPLFLAISRAVGRTDIAVREKHLRLNFGVSRESLVKLPDSAIEFRQQFDNGLRPGPVKFQLDIPDGLFAEAIA